MAVHLNNNARFVKEKGGYNWYDWEVFVDEEDEKINQIDHVIYFLHETFPEPVRTVADPQSRFALKSHGWGEFEVKARVIYKDGQFETINYRLDLSKDEQKKK